MTVRQSRVFAGFLKEKSALSFVICSSDFVDRLPWAKTRSTKSHQAARKKTAKSMESHTIALVVFALPVRISLRGALSPFVTTEPKEKQWVRLFVMQHMHTDVVQLAKCTSHFQKHLLPKNPAARHS